MQGRPLYLMLIWFALLLFYAAFTYEPTDAAVVAPSRPIEFKATQAQTDRVAYEKAQQDWHK